MDAEWERLAAEEDAAWLALHATFELIAPDRFEEPTLTPEGWSPKDAMFHCAAWCAEAANQLERIRLGTYVSEHLDIEALNAEWFEISRTLDAPTVRAELHATRTRMRQEWCELCEHNEPTPVATEWYVESGHVHFKDHRRQLEAWLEGG
jgi:hypothetical protein